MKEEYVGLKFHIVRFGKMDVIMTSGGGAAIQEESANINNPDWNRKKSPLEKLESLK